METGYSVFFLCQYLFTAYSTKRHRQDRCGTHCGKIKRADGKTAPRDGIRRYAVLSTIRRAAARRLWRLPEHDDLRLYATVRVTILISMKSFRYLANDEY